MPKKYNVGYGECTPQKMDDFSRIISMHLAITQSVLKKHNKLYEPKYHYIDLTAGRGHYPNGIVGSPISFITQTESMNFKPSHAMDLIECEPENMDELKVAIEEEINRNQWKTPNISYHLGEYQNEVPKLLPYVSNEFGLVFIDPSGNIPDFKILNYIATMRPKMEILIYISPTIVKRIFQYTGKRLSDYINIIGKEHWLVRRSFDWDKFNWTFLLGSNSDIFRDYKRIRFFRIESKIGQQIIEKFNYTEKEQVESKQLKFM
jgi:three-Cys-motif partner protein